MKTMSKTRKREASNSNLQSVQEAPRAPRRRSVGSTLGDLPAEIYRGLICGYTAKPAGFVAKQRLDKMGKGARYYPRFY
jgi:hypothetical protein